MLRSANLAVKFLLELAAFAALAYWGASTGHGAVRVVLAIAAPVAAIVVWSLCCAPRARWRLAIPARVPLELAVFGLAAGGLAAAGGVTLAIIFGAIVVVNSVLLTVFHQWEQ
ncbi:MAG: DUF2568 domain-containing protein [Streptosporangiaceae bacterium]